MEEDKHAEIYTTAADICEHLEGFNLEDIKVIFKIAYETCEEVITARLNGDQ